MLSGTALLIFLGLLATPQSQGHPTLASRLDAATLAELRPILETARRDSLPVGALENKALEGAAKQIPSHRIVAAVRDLAHDLRAARTTLRAAAPSATPTEGEIVAVVEVQRRGISPDEVATLRRSVAPTTDLEIPLGVLGALVERGVPANQARKVIEHMLDSGVEQNKLVELPFRVDRALQTGAPPIPALNSALAGLGVTGPPMQPPRPVSGKPDRGGG